MSDALGTDYAPKDFLPTGSPTLDGLLAADAKKPKEKLGGILVKDVNPIVLIEGAAGTGKTLLALQIANAVSQAHDMDPRYFRAFFYSLEQSVESLRSSARCYGFSQDGSLFWNLREHADPMNLESGALIYLCHLTQLSIHQREPVNDFEERFEQLQHMVSLVKKASEEAPNDGKWLPVFFIDSLSAFTTSPLGRQDIYRLFQLFRNNAVPAIFTAERYDAVDPQRNASTEAAKFLCDIAIQLSKDTKQDHMQMYLEISKSRVGRQAFGRHLYKIRTESFVEPLRNGDPSAHPGIVVYPSIHSVLSNVRTDQIALPTEPVECGVLKGLYRITDQECGHKNGGNPPIGGDSEANIDTAKSENEDIPLIMKKGLVKAGACFAIVGPTGTHKLALAMNLATGSLNFHSEQISTSSGQPTTDEETGELKQLIDQLSKGKLLIVKFGGSGEVNFGGVAWFKEREKWKSLVDLHPGGTPQKIKWWTTNYGWTEEFAKEYAKKYPDEYKDVPPDRVLGPAADVLTFQLGELTPEECFDVIEKQIFDREKALPKYSAVLLSDTAMLCTGFPALHADRVFLPSLIELFKTNRIVSVCIGVAGGDALSREVDFGLRAWADYRISLNHCPDMTYWMQKIYDKKLDEVKKIEECKDSGLGKLELQKRLELVGKIDISSVARSEQWISLVIDNVMGQDYSRVPLWLRVNPDEKLLMCERTPRNSSVASDSNATTGAAAN